MFELVYRYRVVRHEELPEDHKAEYRMRGENPDENWQLIWSFKDKDVAVKQLLKCRKNAPWWQTYRLMDAGA